MKIIIWISALFAMCTLGYYVVCRIIMVCCGCNMHKAMRKIHNFFFEKSDYSLADDDGFCVDVWQNIAHIIGETRYKQLQEIAQTAIFTPLLHFGKHCGLHFIAISLYCKDDNEKQIIETVITNLVRMYLQVHQLSVEIIAEWTKRNDLKMSVLKISYAMDDEEQRVLGIMKHAKQQQIITVNSGEVIDTNDDKDLML